MQAQAASPTPLEWLSALQPRPRQEPPPQVVQRCLQAIRTHLDMDVAFVAEFAEGARHFRFVDAREGDSLITVGAADPLEDSFCQRVVDGRLPELIQDATQVLEARTLAVTQALPVGAHLSVPIRLDDGSLYGTFCCFSRRGDASLGHRDLRLMRVLAELVAEQLGLHRQHQREHQQAEQRIEAALQDGAMQICYQPIWLLERREIVGFEALSRFRLEPQRGPDRWFAEAAAIGRGPELELRAIGAAALALAHLPQPLYLSVNASPETLCSPELAACLQAFPLDRIVIEVTEHAVVEQYEALAAAVRPLQERGLRLAIDDAGAGYASFRHVLNLAPHLIKLDLSLVRDIHRDRSRQALAAALCGFAKATGCHLVAEGVECAEELSALRELGISKAQGYHLGRPQPLAQALALLQPGTPQ